MELLEQIKENAKKQCKTIVLPEGTEERTIQAADQILGEGIAKIILIGNPAEIQALAQKHNLKNIGKATVIDPESHAKKEQYADLLVELRKSKGMTREQALKLVTDPLYLATLMIKSGDADGEVAGAKNATEDVVPTTISFTGETGHARSSPRRDTYIIEGSLTNRLINLLIVRPIREIALSKRTPIMESFTGIL